MDELIKKLEAILTDCVDHHGYRDVDEAPLHGITIGEAKLIVRCLEKLNHPKGAYALARALDDLMECE